ncbi:hypothetical protein OIO90_005217 [Microbotryomycetes sp. JL221]|nr:hypothetical protein OIO90_005217 [Microbotryomycetes sp. JL221]
MATDYPTSSSSSSSSSTTPSSSMITDDDLLSDLTDSFQLESSRDKQLNAMACLLKGVLPDAPTYAHDHPSTFTTSQYPHHQQRGAITTTTTNLGSGSSTVQSRWTTRPGPPAPSSSYVGSPSTWSLSSGSTSITTTSLTTDNSSNSFAIARQAAAMGGLTPYGTPMTNGIELPMRDQDTTEQDDQQQDEDDRSRTRRHQQQRIYNETVDHVQHQQSASSPSSSSSPQQSRYCLRSSVNTLSRSQTPTQSNFNHHVQQSQPQHYVTSTTTDVDLVPMGWQMGLRAPCVSRERQSDSSMSSTDQDDDMME